MNTLANLVTTLLAQDTNSHYEPLGVLRIHGSDATKLLQGQASCNMTNLSDDSGLYGAICSVKGRIISNFFVVQEQQDILLIMDKALVSTSLNHLKKYAVFFKAELSDASDQFHIHTSFATPSNDTIPDALAEQLAVSRNETGINLLISHYPTLATLHLQPAGADISNQNTRSGISNILTLLTARPLIEAEQSETILPQWLNMQRTGGISFTKGCYTGQEIVARMQYRGKSKKQLALFSWEGNNATSQTLTDSQGKTIGSVFKSAQYNELNIAQVILNIEPAEADSFFLGEQAIKLLPLPYQLESKK